MPIRKFTRAAPKSARVAMLGGVSRICSYALVVVVLAGTGAYFKKGALPRAAEISRELLKEPAQEPTGAQPFSFTYRGETYQVQPVADYRIAALVVSHNDISAFGDIYHDETSVDIKDVCLLWGANLIDDTFRRVRFHNESVSCHYYAPGEAAEIFDPARISNNHLIAADETVRAAIRSVRVGDQIELEGMLVNYAPASHPDRVRRTSTVRSDSGGGACEVMYVSAAKILKAAPRRWFRLYELCWSLLYVLLPGKIALIILVPWLDLRLNR